MPKASKIRVSNIRLDSDLKIIGDQTFDLLGNNTIFLLENGGGKTSIIQLIHQVVLPNYTIQKKKLSDTVKKSSTRHIAVEWISDDDNYPNFVTGFCYKNYGSKQSGLDRPYDYFNYLFEYDGEDGLSIEDLPFISNNKPIDLEGLKSELSQTPGVHLFSSNKEYSEAIEQYGLLESEWKNIAKVNGEEGGVTNFFDDTNKTITLIDRLLIPSLTESIYDTKEERNAILDSFKKYKSGLLQLPELEKNLQDFEIILDHSDPIIDSFKELEDAVQELNIAKENLTKLYLTVTKESSDNEELLLSIEKQLSDMERQEKTLNWKLDSYKIHLLNEQDEKHSSECKNKGLSLERLKREKDLINNRIKEQRAAKAYDRYKDHNKKYNEVSSQLRVAELDAEKQNSEFIKTKKEISQKYQYLLDGLLRSKSESSEQLNKVHQHKTDNQDYIESQEDEKSNLQKDIALLEAFIKQYGEDKLFVQNKVGGLWKDNLVKTRENIEIGLKQLQNEQKNNEVIIAEMESKAAFIRENIVRINNVLPGRERELESAEEDFDLFAKEEASLKDQLRATINMSLANDMFDDKDVILFNLERKQKELQNEHTKVSVSLDHLNQLKGGIEQRGYHVHPEIEEVKEFLVQKNIGVISGVEWITNSKLNEKEKYELLKKNPMLSFSILAESNQMKAIRNKLKLFKKNLTIPIIFLDRLRLNNQNPKEKFYEIEDLFVFDQIDTKLTAEEWESHTQELEGMIDEIASKEQNLIHKLNRIGKINYQLQHFHMKYNQFSRERYSKQIEQLELDILETTNEKQKFKDDLVTLEEEKRQVEQEQKTILIRVSEFKEYLLYVQTIIDRYVDIDTSFNDLEVKKQLLDSVLNEIDKLKRVDEEVEDRHKNLQKVIEGIDTKVNHLKRDFDEYDYEATEEKMTTDEVGYEKSKSYYNQLRNESLVEHSQIRNLQQNLNTHQEMLNDLIKEIGKNDFTIESIAKIYITYDEDLLDQLEFDYESADMEIRELEKSLAVLNSKIDITREELKEERNKIEELYSDTVSAEPFEYSPVAESEYKTYQTTKDSLVYKRKKLTSRLEKIKNFMIRLNTALEELERRKSFFVHIQEIVAFEAGEWDASKPMDDVHKYNSAIENQQRKISNRERKIQTNIWSLREDAQQTDNKHLLYSINQFIQIFDGSSYDEAVESFYKMLEGIEGYRQSLEARKKHSDASRNELVEQMFQRAEVIHKNIIDIAKSSQIEDDGEVINLIQITWPKNEMSYAKHQLLTFINGVLGQLTDLKRKGALEKEIDDNFDKLASLYNIVNCYADVSKCNIRVLKPRNELLSMNKEYANWDHLDTHWSAGERQIGRISMFISFLNHLRKTRFAKEMSWKFLVFDNPFDKIQSEHVVRPMAELAKRSKTQLLCFTGINDKLIQQEFETVISNQYIEQHGTLLLSSETKHKEKSLEFETLFYSR